MEEVYERLREYLDHLGSGYPRTESRVEMRILKRLFTEEDAELFLGLTPLLETPEDAAKRLGRDPEETAAHMERMAKKGLIFRHRKDGLLRYSAAPFVVGIFEFQVGTLDRELAEDMQEYYETAFGSTIQSFQTPVLRTIPINRDMVSKWPVAPYEDVLEIMNAQDVIAVAPCICRKEAQLMGEACDKPMEACFVFGSHARYYVDNHMARYISKEEAGEIVKKNDEAGLVMQPFNAQKIGGMCSCCGCCCGVLRSLKMQPVPAVAVQSNYFAQVEEEACIGCETCVERCQMEAIDMVEDRAVVNLDRCIGCGLCVSTCTTEAMRLIKKPDAQLYQPPETGAETYLKIAAERGKDLLSAVQKP
jgi:Fe-S-cluster-containing hydrogenase component 2